MAVYITIEEDMEDNTDQNSDLNQDDPISMKFIPILNAKLWDDMYQNQEVD